MIAVRPMSLEDCENLPIISDNSFVSESVNIKVARTGINLGYVPLQTSFFTSIPPSYTPSQAIHDGNYAFAVFENGEYAGNCVLRKEDNNWLEIADIRVNAANRRHGAATLLISTAFSVAKSDGMAGLHIVCTDNNPVLCQCCEKLGFSVGGFDKYARAFTESELRKPMTLRTCALHFYKWKE